jgi:hypothetical protein
LHVCMSESIHVSCSGSSSNTIQHNSGGREAQVLRQGGRGAM